VRERDDRLQPRLVRVVGRVERERDVVADPDRLEARVLREPGAPDERVGRRVLALVQSVEGRTS
jgi:hypothetical protein